MCWDIIVRATEHWTQSHHGTEWWEGTGWGDVAISQYVLQLMKMFKKHYARWKVFVN